MKKKKKYSCQAKRGWKFFEKIKNKGPKIHYFSLKSAKRCIRDSPYLGQRGGAMAPMPPPGSATAYAHITLKMKTEHATLHNNQST